MRIGLAEPDWEYIGACLAQSDDHNQATFFKSFCRECRSWGTNYQVESQLAGVNMKLTKEEKNILGMLGWEEREGATPT